MWCAVRDNVMMFGIKVVIRELYMRSGIVGAVCDVQCTIIIRGVLFCVICGAVVGIGYMISVRCAMCFIGGVVFCGFLCIAVCVEWFTVFRVRYVVCCAI